MKKKPVQDLKVSETILTGVSASEPIIEKYDLTDEDEVRAYQGQMAKALNWYNASWDEKAYHRSAIQYVKKTGLKSYVPAVESADFLDIRMVGVIGRLILRDQFVSPDHIEKLMNKLTTIKEKTPKKSVSSEVVTEKKTVQDRIQDLANAHIAELEGAIDDLIVKGTEFSVQAYLTANEVSGQVAKRISDYFKPILEELKLIKIDDEVREAYGYLTTSKIKKMTALVESFVTDSEQQKVSATVRKPRKTKPKSPAKLVEKLKYMKTFEELGMKSVKATDLVGASEAWFYDTTKRKLTVYHAADGGLSVKGTTILNFDVNTSETKMIRKPSTLKGVTGKRAMNNLWKSIKTKGSKPNGRTNDNMIIVSVN